MTNLNTLLKKGYFPKELPPPLTSASFANLVSSNATSVPSTTNSSTLASKHNIARVGNLRRKLSIPNPINQLKLSGEIVQNWSLLNPLLYRTNLSKSKPTPIINSKRALSYMYRPAALINFRAEHRMNAKYLLTTDITEFYHSIYTHTIPWALHGKSKAKARRFSRRLFGNRLDVLVRNGQDAQTVGIPIGPDTSLLLSEIVLSKTDTLLTKKIRPIKGFRYVDDYELCFSKRSEAENALNIIESTLSDYELRLNPRKTTICKLPLSMDDYWAAELNRFEFKSGIASEGSDLIAFFSRAFDLAKKNPEASVLRYAIAKFRSIRVDSRNWLLLQSLLLQCISSEPGTLPYVFEILVRFFNDRYFIMTDWLENVLNAQIEQHVPLGHGSEVAWSLCTAIAFDVPLHQKAARAVSRADDSIVILLALDAEQRGLFATSLNKNKWVKRMTTKSLYDEHWLLSYEANVKGWLPSRGVSDHVASDRFFGWLKTNGISFYDTSLASATLPDATLPMDGGFWSFGYE